ncbi:phosphoribosylformylglycinamidine synthase I [Candidatus Marinamargulisbacteria bacterium SCGC AAA071-K20]|nr:phosphoribosylformylglycinamidine synthase I [Candidatus Marinamargulisbacteria bacterium SCGC AAA071-K20]
MSKKLAVIQFPGSNCEYETVYAANQFGFDAEIIPWNCSEDLFMSFDVYILPGGFSFQDRVRAGAVSAKLPVMSYLEKVCDEGRPILGICNGCQILSESGLVPDISDSHKIEIALAPNTKNNDSFGFMCEWVFVKVDNPGANVFTRSFNSNDVIPIPINHGEGRFIFSSDIDPSTLPVTTLKYCNSKGEVIESYPTNPNGTSYNIAAISNKKGNVLAIMPHPERASFLHQIPHSIDSEWSLKKQAKFKSGYTTTSGPWEKLFTSVKESLESCV